MLDSSSIHKTLSIQRWLVRHSRFTVHFPPTHSSWLNLVERWFAELTTGPTAVLSSHVARGRP